MNHYSNEVSFDQMHMLICTLSQHCTNYKKNHIVQTICTIALLQHKVGMVEQYRVA